MGVLNKEIQGLLRQLTEVDKDLQKLRTLLEVSKSANKSEQIYNIEGDIYCKTEVRTTITEELDGVKKKRDRMMSQVDEWSNRFEEASKEYNRLMSIENEEFKSSSVS